MQLYFIRHGQSSNNALFDDDANNQTRSEDPPLTEKGLRQARHLAEFLRAENGAPRVEKSDPDWDSGPVFTHIYTSLMIRAVATAACIASALDLPLVAWSSIHEGGGIYLDDPESGAPQPLSGKPRSYFERHFPQLVLPETLGEEGWWNRPFETRPERRQRARAFLADLLERHGDQPHRVAVVSHGGFYNHFLSVLFGLQDGTARATVQSLRARDQDNVILQPEDSLWFVLNNAGVSRFDFLPGEVWVAYLNRVDFLPPDLVT